MSNVYGNPVHVQKLFLLESTPLQNELNNMLFFAKKYPFSIKDFLYFWHFGSENVEILSFWATKGWRTLPVWAVLNDFDLDQ